MTASTTDGGVQVRNVVKITVELSLALTQVDTPALISSVIYGALGLPWAGQCAARMGSRFASQELTCCYVDLHQSRAQMLADAGQNRGLIVSPNLFTCY